MKVPEILVLAHHDPVIARRDSEDLVVRCGVTQGKVECVNRIVSAVVQVAGEAPRELRVDDEPHAAPSGSR